MKNQTRDNSCYEHRPISKAHASLVIPPKSSCICKVNSPRSLYFKPVRCRIACLDAANPCLNMDLKIGSVTVGGSPQLAINCLDPDDESQGIRATDIDTVIDWGIFSSPGLGREIQFHFYNPNNQQVAVFICMDGFDIESLSESGAKYSTQGRRPVVINDSQGNTPALMSGSDIHLEPYEQGAIYLTQTMGGLFEPGKIKFNGVRIETGTEVPFTVLDAFCNNRMLYGAINIEDLIRQANAYMKISTNRSPLERHLNSQHHKNSPKGLLTDHFNDDCGWHDVSWWPAISKVLIIVYNPWLFDIRVNATLGGFLIK